MVDYLSTKLNKALCIECQFNKGQLREKSDGNLLPPGLKICVECRERKIRQFRNLSILTKRMSEEGENVRLVF